MIIRIIMTIIIVRVTLTCYALILNMSDALPRTGLADHLFTHLAGHLTAELWLGALEKVVAIDVYHSHNSY